jgi:predicted nuclease of predicted toxin-antitoxin system
VKFLLDANLSPAVGEALVAHGHEGSCHVREVSLRDASDEEILDHARLHGFVLISQDSDFTNLLFRAKSDRPSLIFRAPRARRGASCR